MAGAHQSDGSNFRSPPLGVQGECGTNYYRACRRALLPMPATVPADAIGRREGTGPADLQTSLLQGKLHITIY